MVWVVSMVGGVGDVCSDCCCDDFLQVDDINL